MRSFIAVTVGASITGRVAEAAAELRSVAEEAGVRVRWTRREGWHVTLKFLGDVCADGQDAGERVRTIAEALEPVVAARAEFDVRASGIAAFPRASAPRVIAALVDQAGGDGGALSALAASVEDAVEPLGFERERRRFRPHLTLGRVRDARDASGRDMRKLTSAIERMRDLDLGTDLIREVGLFESELGPGGAHYVRRAGFALAATPAAGASGCDDPERGGAAGGLR